MSNVLQIFPEGDILYREYEIYRAAVMRLRSWLSLWERQEKPWYNQQPGKLKFECH